MPEALGLVSVEDTDGRILTGADGDESGLQETVDRRAEAHEEAREARNPGPPPLRNGQGQFASADKGPQRPSRGQKRFDELTRQAGDAQRAREAAERERDELRRQLEDARKPVERVAPELAVAPRQGAPVGKAPETRSKPTEDDVGTKYQSYSEFVEDLADWKAEQRLAQLDFDARIRQSIEADRASRGHLDKMRDVTARGQQTYADFDAVLKADHMTRSDWPADKIAAIAALESPEHVQYALGKDPVLAERLRTMDLVGFGMELTKLITPAAVASPASTARVMSPPPPAPYQPVQGGGRTTVTSSASLAEDGDSDFDRSGYRETRARERGVQRRW